MDVTSPMQSSQGTRTHENFCVQFCAQMEKYMAAGGDTPPNREKYVAQIRKIISQLSEERRWKNFTNFVKLHCERDGGRLFSKFVKNWFAALAHIDSEKEHILPMLLLIMEELKTDNIICESVVILNNVLEEELLKMSGADIKAFGANIAENFMSGWQPTKRWLSAAAIFLRCMVKPRDNFIEWEGNSVNGMEYRNEFLLKLLEDVASCNSFKDLIILLRECFLLELIDSFAEKLMQKEPMPEIFLKLIIVLPELISWKGEQVCDHLLAKADFPVEDLYTLCFELRILFESHTTMSKLFFARLKHHRHLVSCSRFALICMLCLCNIPRYHSASTAELKQNVVKLQKHSDRLRASAWIRDVMSDNDVEALKGNLDAVIDAVISDAKWNAVLGDALEHVALMLMLDKCDADLKVSDGRIVGDAGVLSMGKSMLLSLARVNTAAIGQLLERILTTLAACNKHNSALVLIDTIVEIVLKHTVHVLNAWKSLQPWIENICDLRQDISISLIRALLPVIVLRPQLVTIILKRLKKDVLCDSTVATALPVLLLLLRSSTMRSAIRSDYYSQSFATFSTQALQNMGVDTKSTNVELSLEVVGILKRTFTQPANVKSTFYRGVVEAAFANQNLVRPILDLLLAHFITLQAISRCAYIDSSKSSTVLLEPVSDLVQAVSALVRLSIYTLRNTSTQVACGRISQAMAELDKLIEFALDRDIHDLQLDKLSDFSLTAVGRTNLCFASLMSSLYDALIEHLWHVCSVLTRRETAEKMLALLRRREELNEVLKEKMAKRKECKGDRATVVFPSTKPQIQTISSMVSRFIRKVNEEDIDVDEGCLQLLRENAFAWTMDWAQRISIDISKCASHAPFVALSSFSRAMLLLYVGGNCVHELASLELWDHKCTQAVIAFSNVISFMISKYGARCDGAIMEIWRMVGRSKVDLREHEQSAGISLMIRYILTDLLPKLLEAHKDFLERKMASDFTHQAAALIAACRALFKQVYSSDEKAQVMCAKLSRGLLQRFEIVDKTVLKEMWEFYVHIERTGSCGTHYTNFLRTAAANIITSLGDENREAGESLASINDITVEKSAEMVAGACSASLSDARLATEMMFQLFLPSVDAGLVKVLNMCSRLADVVRLLLPVHIDYAMARGSICILLTALYDALNAVVKLLLKRHKDSDISEWMALTKLADLARGSVLRIMESADENVGTLDPMDEPSLSRHRKVSKTQKDEALYVTYVRSRELYQANLLLLCSAVHDQRLDIQVRNNSIGVRDFRIDAEKLRQRMEELGEKEDDKHEDQTQGDQQQQPPRKRIRVGTVDTTHT